MQLVPVEEGVRGGEPLGFTASRTASRGTRIASDEIRRSFLGSTETTIHRMRKQSKRRGKRKTSARHRAILELAPIGPRLVVVERKSSGEQPVRLRGCPLHPSPRAPLETMSSPPASPSVGRGSDVSFTPARCWGRTALSDPGVASHNASRQYWWSLRGIHVDPDAPSPTPSSASSNPTFSTAPTSRGPAPAPARPRERHLERVLRRLDRRERHRVAAIRPLRARRRLRLRGDRRFPHRGQIREPERGDGRGPRSSPSFSSSSGSPS